MTLAIRISTKHCKVEPVISAAQLRKSVSGLRIRRLNQERKLAAALILGIGQATYRRCRMN